jgi:hypothetical protein
MLDHWRKKIRIGGSEDQGNPEAAAEVGHHCAVIVSAVSRMLGMGRSGCRDKLGTSIVMLVLPIAGPVPVIAMMRVR